MAGVGYAPAAIMGTPLESTQWERRHVNGWTATVRAGGPDAFICFVYTEQVANDSDWACVGIDDLTRALEMADAHVPAHRCDCPPWGAFPLW